MQPLTTGADATPSWTEPDPSSPPPVWGDYHSLGGSYDEFRAADGGVRPHWQPFALALEMLGAEEIKRRWEESQDLIRQNGVTYNVYGDPRGMDRPWQLDPIPLLIAPEEWTTLEAGLVQRARLLDLILADLYGPQRLLARGSCRRTWFSATPASCTPATGSRFPPIVTCISTP